MTCALSSARNFTQFVEALNHSKNLEFIGRGSAHNLIQLFCIRPGLAHNGFEFVTHFATGSGIEAMYRKGIDAGTMIRLLLDREIQWEHLEAIEWSEAHYNSLGVFSEKRRAQRFKQPPPHDAFYDQATNIYFIQCNPPSGPIKIGYTQGQVAQRMEQLQSANPYPLQILTSFVSHRREEAELHLRFAEYHMRGEWFSPGPKLLEFIHAKNHLSRMRPT